MSRYLDSSVLVASLVPDDPDDAACDNLLSRPGNWTSLHALNETFASLTGGRLGMRVDAEVAAMMIRESVVPCVQFVDITLEDILEAQKKARQQGVRGGAVYDYMHLVAARKAGVAELRTLNFADFRALARWRSTDSSSVKQRRTCPQNRILRKHHLPPSLVRP